MTTQMFASKLAKVKNRICKIIQKKLAKCSVKVKQIRCILETEQMGKKNMVIM